MHALLSVKSASLVCMFVNVKSELTKYTVYYENDVDLRQIQLLLIIVDDLKVQTEDITFFTNICDMS
jgi:hypothetical protein